LDQAEIPILQETVRAERQRRAAQKAFDQDIETAGGSLVSYIRAAWHVLEPAHVYIHGWHIEAIAEHLEAITAGQIRRLIINVPPGMTKSMSVSVFWPTWEWGPKRLPHLRTISTAYREHLALRDNRRAKNLIQSLWYQERWGDVFQIKPDKAGERLYENDHEGWRAGMPFDSITGERGDRINIDDPLSVTQAKSTARRTAAKETFLEALPNRLVDPKRSAITMIMQRLHEEDPTGIALAKNLGYEHLMLPMEFEPDRRCYSVVMPRHFDAGLPIEARYDSGKQIWYKEGENDPEKQVPDNRVEYVKLAPVKTVYNQDPRTADGDLLFEARFPREVVESDRVSLGSGPFAGQNQQRPAPREGNLFKLADFKFMDAIPDGTEFCRGWDMAATETAGAARTAGVKIGRMPDGGFLVAHLVAEMAGPFDVKKLIKVTAERDGYDCEIALPQDPGSAGKVQAADLIAHLAGFVVSAKTATGDKVTRALPFSAQVEAGNVYLLRGPWNAEYLDEITTFPDGKRKDIGDASAEAFNRLTRTPQKTGFAAPILIEK